MRLIAEKLSYNRRNINELNPVLFDEDEKLKPEIREKILAIVDEFLKYTQVDIRILDIRLVGSNAAYNYTEDSDLDIHIVTDLSEISDPEMIARLYFDSIKRDFKDSYDITIKGIEVEVYIEDVNTAAISNGVYSVSQDQWIKEPTIPVSPDAKDLDLAEEMEEEIIDAINACKTIEDLQTVVDKLYLMRKDSLAKDGEIGAGNLAFKSLRDKGILDKVKQLLRDAKSKELSLESKKMSEGKALSDADVDRIVGKWEEKSGDSVLDDAYDRVRKAEAAYHMTTKRAREYAAKLENKMRREKGIPSLRQYLSHASQKKFEVDIKDIKSKVSRDPEYLKLSKEAEKAIAEYANTTYDLKRLLRVAKSRGVDYPNEYYRASIQWDDHD